VRLSIKETKEMLKESDLIEGQAYRITKAIDGNRKGTLVIFNWMVDSKDGKKRYCILSPNGEPDMQSMFSCELHNLEPAD